MSDLDDWLTTFTAAVDAIQANPPAAPEGMERVSCDEHWPTYMAHVEGQYGGPGCHQCTYSRQRDRIEELEHRSHHRWWKWRAYRWLARHGYTLGLTSGSVWGNGCKHCGTTTRIHWRGKRSYILGRSRESWECLLRYHHRRTPHQGCGLCTTCMPCPDCGSTAVDHYSCGGGES